MPLLLSITTLSLVQYSSLNVCPVMSASSPGVHEVGAALTKEKTVGEIVKLRISVKVNMKRIWVFKF